MTSAEVTGALPKGTRPINAIGQAQAFRESAPLSLSLLSILISPIDPGRESSFTAATENTIGIECEVVYTLESGSPQGKVNGSWRKEKVEASWFRISCYPGLDSTCLHCPELVKKNCRVLEYHLRLQYCMNTARKKDIGMAKCFLGRPSTELYPGYKFLFLFDYATSHSVYASDVLRASKMNKGDGGQQPFIRNGWFHDGETIRQK